MDLDSPSIVSGTRPLPSQLSVASGTVLSGAYSTLGPPLYWKSSKPQTPPVPRPPPPFCESGIPNCCTGRIHNEPRPSIGKPSRHYLPPYTIPIVGHVSLKDIPQ